MSEPGEWSAPGDPKALLARASRLRKSVIGLGAWPDRLSAQIERAFVAVRSEMVGREAAGIPIARLKETTDGRLRLGALERAGYRTVGSILDVTATRLQSIDGVGPGTAAQVIAAARQVADAVETGLRFRVDLDPSNRLSTELVTTLYRAESLTRIMDQHRSAANRIANELKTAMAEAAPAGSRMRMLLRGQRRRQQAQTAIARVATLLDESDGTGFTAAIERAERIVDSSVDLKAAAWQDFETRSVEYYGRLGGIVDLGLDVAAAEGFLPSEIVEKVSLQKLDDTFRRVSLRGYQSFGARFALVQRRAIIGDEMGLGKTIQAIAVMAHLRALGKERMLVACPASVLVNWEREVSARSTLRPFRVHGPERVANLRN